MGYGVPAAVYCRRSKRAAARADVSVVQHARQMIDYVNNLENLKALTRVSALKYSADTEHFEAARSEDELRDFPNKWLDDIKNYDERTQFLANVLEIIARTMPSDISTEWKAIPKMLQPSALSPDPGTAMPGYHLPGTQPAPSSSLPQVPHYSLYPPGAPATTGQTAYADGQRDRQAWEDWYNNLPEGDYKRGAFYWSSVRSTNKAASACQVSVQYAAWISGCHAAKAMLDPSDNRRDTEPDYRAGWNRR